MSWNAYHRFETVRQIKHLNIRSIFAKYKRDFFVFLDSILDGVNGPTVSCLGEFPLFFKSI